MKKTLEAVLVVAALALGAFVVRKALARRESAAHPVFMNPASAPGADSEDPDAQPRPLPPRGVQGLPMVKLTHPAKPSRRTTAVPPPVSPAR
jgi:hypothetical protein